MTWKNRYFLWSGAAWADENVAACHNEKPQKVSYKKSHSEKSKPYIDKWFKTESSSTL